MKTPINSTRCITLVGPSQSGKTTLMELLIIYNDLENYLSNKGIKVFKPLINEYITTQESAGFSISLLNSNEQMRRLWSSPSSAPYFHL